MNRSRLSAAVIIAGIFALIGVFLADIINLPSPFTINTTRLVYATLGILISILYFSQITQWVAKTTARLATLAIKRLALEISTQVAIHNPFQSSEGSAKLKTDLSGVIIIDTSSLIDGRLLEVANTGFLCGLILIPDFVLRELQLVADSADHIKRARGRRGFEIVHKLKKIRSLKVEVWDKQSLMLRNKTLSKISESDESKDVDDRLISLTKTLNGKLLTCDFNLNQVGKLRGITVLNINELTNALKTLPIPGERLRIKIIHPGKDKDQMVGYLPDGTMVVVKDAPQKLDTEIEVTVSKVIQGQAGRMVFAKAAGQR